MAQDWPNGVYFSIEEFRNRMPRGQFPLELLQRDESGMKWMGGNEYRFRIMIEQFDTINLKWSPHFIVHEGELYINTTKIERGMGYAKCLTKGNFLVFTLNSTNYRATAAAGVVGGAAGALIAGALTPFESETYIHSLRTGNTRKLTLAYVQARLESHQELLLKLNDDLKGYETPPNDILIKYVNKLNELTEIGEPSTNK